MVGGATRMPGVGTFLQHMTGLTPRASAIDPDGAVAAGAALHAASLSGHAPMAELMDTWQASLMRALARQKQKNAEFDLPEGDSDGGSFGGSASESGSDGAAAAKPDERPGRRRRRRVKRVALPAAAAQ